MGKEGEAGEGGGGEGRRQQPADPSKWKKPILLLWLAGHNGKKKEGRSFLLSFADFLFSDFFRHGWFKGREGEREGKGRGGEGRRGFREKGGRKRQQSSQERV